MPPENQSSVSAAAAKPRMFCKKCGYALVGLESRVCPECGRGFDPGNRRTFARRPLRAALWRWGRRVLAVVLLLAMAAGVGLFWLRKGWLEEQPTITQLRELRGTRQRFTVAPIGPPRLCWVLGERLGYLADRVDWIAVGKLYKAETEQLDFRSLTQIQKLELFDCDLSNRKLNSLADLAKLEDLRLTLLSIEKPDLAFLEKLPALTNLYLQGDWVPSSGYETLGRLKHLQRLTLYDTGLSDADLQQLQGLSSLEELRFRSHRITDAGLEHLQGLKSLKRLVVDQRLANSPGMAKLKQALPGLQVIGFLSPPY